MLLLKQSIINFTSRCRKIVRHTFKILQQMLCLLSVSEHFTTLRSKGLEMYFEGEDGDIMSLCKKSSYLGYNAEQQKVFFTTLYRN